MEQATLDEGSTPQPRLHLALELSAKEWKLGFSDGKGIRTVGLAAVCWGRLGVEIAQAKRRFGLPEDAAVVSCYEAGRDGFWIHRFLGSLGVSNVVVEPASIEVDRRARRRKTDRLDTRKLLSLLVRHASGERDVCRTVRVPDPGEEDGRRPQRERERLVKERTQHRARLQALLVLQGIRGKVGPDFAEGLETRRCWDGEPLPEHLRRELQREWRRLDLVDEQLAEVEREQRRRAAAGATASDRQVRALAGLTGTPYSSGDSVRDQGISKAGNRRVRTMMVELAWSWLRWQPQSELSRWFQRRTGPGKRMRRVMIVALARRLLVALWHFLRHGLIPEGAVLSRA